MSIVYDMGADLQDDEDDDGVNLYFGIFFDGTSNNRKNVEAREAWEAANGGDKWGGGASDASRINQLFNPLEQLAREAANEVHTWILPEEEKEAAYRYFGDKKDDSYENDKSNVNRMEPYYKKAAKIFKLYIEGIATSDLGSDDNDAAAFGRGATGIRGKVKKACFKVAAKCKPYRIIDTITFDVFGFSRGAAAARNFVWEVLTEKGIKFLADDDDVDNQVYLDGYYSYFQSNVETVPTCGFLGYYLNDQGTKLRMKPRIRFVGLYDTVPSYDKDFSMILESALGRKPNFKDNIKQLHLNDVIRAERVIHLMAENEHRENFALASTQCIANSEPDDYQTSGQSIALPGVHCDVGGSYTSGPDGEIVNCKYAPASPLKGIEELELDKRALVEECWFKKEELELVPGWFYILNGKRDFLSNEYSFIALHMLTDFANRKKENMFNFEVLKKDYKIEECPTPVIDSLPGRIEQFLSTTIADYQRVYSKYETWKIVYSTSELRRYHPSPPVPEPYPLYMEKQTNRLLRSFYTAKVSNKEILWYVKKRLNDWVFNGGQPLVFKYSNDLMVSHPFENPKDAIPPGLTEALKEQIVYRLLRNRFLHWSSNYNGAKRLEVLDCLIAPMAPNTPGPGERCRKRQEYHI